MATAAAKTAAPGIQPSPMEAPGMNARTRHQTDNATDLNIFDPRGKTMSTQQLKAKKAMRIVSRARASVSVAVIASLMAATVPANATIDNLATANGTPSRGTLTPPTANRSVPVAPLSRSLLVSKSVSTVTDGNGNNSGSVDGAGDIVRYRYVITNNGNATLTNVAPVDVGPTFNGVNRTNTLSAFTHQPADPSNTSGVTPASVAPGQSVVFTATYTVSSLDFLRGSQVNLGMDNAASGTANGAPTSNTSTVETNIPASPSLQIVKTFSITTDNGTSGQADLNDIITYTYTVTNNGNVAINNVSITDLHEGVPVGAGLVTTETLVSDGPLAAATPAFVSNDSTSGTNGTWDLLQPGAVITFKYIHTVNQTEFDNQ
jgi:large repetitive protein